jgi:hypothetical protein
MYVHARKRSGTHQRMRHVVAIAHVDEFAPP